MEAVEPNAIQIRLDGSGDRVRDTGIVSIPVKDYQSFDHGYATTIHKAQGATVDRAFVMASSTMDRHLTYVAMTRHRHEARLYAGRDELTDMKEIVASMSRSGAKETTLDYTNVFAERRGLTSKVNDTDEIKLEVATAVAHDVQRLTGRPVGQTQDRPHERRQADEEPVYDLVGPALNALDAAYGLEHVQADQGARLVAPADVPAPLIPAVRFYDGTVEDIAREKALPNLVSAMEDVRSVSREVYVNPEQAAATLSAAIVDKGIEASVLARSLIETPEQFGPLRGKVGLLGENKERKLARHHTQALGNHVLSAANTWQRRLEAERKSETWKRERQDIVEIPGLTLRSQALLHQFDSLALEDRPTFLKHLLTTPEGQTALAEARTITAALEQRFGSADPRTLKPDPLRLEPDIANKLDQIKYVARIVERVHRVELTQQYELKQSLRKGLGLKM